MTFKGKFPNKKLLRDKKHLNEAGIKIFASNLLHILKSIYYEYSIDLNVCRMYTAVLNIL